MPDGVWQSGELSKRMHTTILKRVGLVLAVAGSIGLALAVWFAPGWRLFEFGVAGVAVVAGILLLRGNMAAARFVRAAASCVLGIVVVAVLGLASLQPFDLTLTEIRLDPMRFCWPATYAIVGVLLLLWTVRELGREPVQAASAEIGLRRWDPMTPAKAGAGVTAVVAGLLWLSLHGQSAQLAESLALQQLGPGYRYSLSSIHGADNGRGTSVSGVVTAWNDKEIKEVLLHWETP
jgi:hypothetical protein